MWITVELFTDFLAIIHQEAIYFRKEDPVLSDNKIVSYKKPFRPRVGTMILLVILVYIAAVAWNYLKKEHVSIYEVNETSIADDSTLTGFIIRNEEVIRSEESGYVNFYHADQSKVGKNEVVYTLDGSGSIGELLEQVGADSTATAADIANMREVISDFYTNFKTSSYYNIKDFHYNIENTIFEQSRDNLYSDLKKQLSENNFTEDFTRCRSKASGILSYSIDGYEEMTPESVTPELFQKVASVERRQLSSSEKIEKDTPVYKLVSNEDWKIILLLTEELEAKLREMDTVRVTVKRDNVSFNAELSIQNNGGTNFAVLSMSRFMGRYLNDRFLDIELNLNSAEGFKIPNSSILTKELAMIPENLATSGGDDAEKGVLRLIYDKEGGSRKEFMSLADCPVSDGYYYVSESVLKPGDTIIDPSNNEPYIVQETAEEEGVYCVNMGYCQFKKIEKIYENNEYTIISSDTTGGISNFDHIVVNPERINEDDFVQ